jgi:hypothetical protein
MERRKILVKIDQRLGTARDRANAAVTEERVRETLLFLGFEELISGYFVRTDDPFGRTRDVDAARIMTTVRVQQLVQNAAGLNRVVERFSRIHGRLER